jgi:hypothetical protein
MHQRFLPWLLVCAFFTAMSLRAQAQSGPGVFDPQKNAGQILVAKLSGKVTKTLRGVSTDVKFEEVIEQSAKINTGPDGSVILSFSNGATTRLGADSELVIDEFLQDPFSDLGSVKIKELDKEPSPSRTKISLNRGELVGDVKQLRHDQNSSFTVQTPVGAAGIRGTVFRIVFRPGANGQAFFQLTTASGRVDYTQPGQGGTTPGVTSVTASGTAGVQVPQGQEIEILVNVTTNAQGQMVVTALPPAPSTTNSVNPTTLTQVTSVAVEIAAAVQNAVYTSQTSSSGSTTGSGTTTGTISGNSSTTTNNNQSGSGGQGNQGQGQGGQGQGGTTTTTTTTTTQTENASVTTVVTKTIPTSQLPETSKP